MDSPEEPFPVINGIEDQPILYPCFRYAEVKEAISHIALKLGFIDKTSTSIPYLFFYRAQNIHLHIMVTPVHYDCNQMCYAFRYIIVGTSRLPVQHDSLNPYLSSEWYIHPLNLYLDLVQRIHLPDSRRWVDPSAITRGLLKESSHSKTLDVEDSSGSKLGQKERKLLTALEVNGFGFSAFSEILSLSFWGVTPDFLYRLAAYGYRHFSIEEICSVWRSRIPLRYLKGFAAAGYNQFKVEEYELLYSFDIDPASAGALTERGVKNLSPEDLIRLAPYETGAGRLLRN